MPTRGASAPGYAPSPDLSGMRGGPGRREMDLSRVSPRTPSGAGPTPVSGLPCRARVLRSREADSAAAIPNTPTGAGAAAWWMEPPLDAVIHRLKYGGVPALAVPLGDSDRETSTAPRRGGGALGAPSPHPAAGAGLRSGGAPGPGARGPLGTPLCPGDGGAVPGNPCPGPPPLGGPPPQRGSGVHRPPAGLGRRTPLGARGRCPDFRIHPGRGIPEAARGRGEGRGSGGSGPRMRRMATPVEKARGSC